MQKGDKCFIVITGRNLTNMPFIEWAEILDVRQDIYILNYPNYGGTCWKEENTYKTEREAQLARRDVYLEKIHEMERQILLMQKLVKLREKELENYQNEICIGCGVYRGEVSSPIFEINGDGLCPSCQRKSSCR